MVRSILGQAMNGAVNKEGDQTMNRYPRSRRTPGLWIAALVLALLGASTTQAERVHSSWRNQKELSVYQKTFLVLCQPRLPRIPPLPVLRTQTVTTIEESEFTVQTSFETVLFSDNAVYERRTDLLEVTFEDGEVSVFAFQQEIQETLTFPNGVVFWRFRGVTQEHDGPEEGTTMTTRTCRDGTVYSLFPGRFEQALERYALLEDL